MMMHDAHDHLPNYHPDQILHDGCQECEYRGEHDVATAIAGLDSSTFVRAWHRAAELQRHGLKNGSVAEVRVLRALALVQVRLEPLNVPLGVVPCLDEEGQWAGIEVRTSTSQNRTAQ